ncbi:flagellar assembly protein FliH [Alginatibacterium sediminis]|uniref:Flagellar assembly protein FliH n=1 Tax=Alginatibacterium sediminis TaxID=2164068 RepID=A0A420EFL0_9ALTE|nr:flagellar assembly protein FliH [Alginatibacterium sediminis]RKF19482.1 flagellar assembly protein FliH [Alginatibacterium sediminis]
MSNENQDIDVDALLQDVAQQAQPETTAGREETNEIDDLVSSVSHEANLGSDGLNTEPESEIDATPPWDLPEFDDNLDSEAAAQTNALNMRADWFEKEDETLEPEEPEYVPMTIEELEALRQSAYDDGFAEGREAGIEKGQQEGHALGLEQGQQQGYEEGQAKGISEGQSQIDTLSTQWESLIEQLYTPQQQLDQALEQQVLDLVLSLTQQVIQTELSTNPQIILATLKQAIQALPVHQQQTSIYLHPEDLTIVEAAFPKDSQEKQKWVLIADGSLGQGDCRVESELSSVNVDMSAIISEAMARFISQNKDLNDTNESSEPV